MLVLSRKSTALHTHQNVPQQIFVKSILLCTGNCFAEISRNSHHDHLPFGGLTLRGLQEQRETSDGHEDVFSEKQTPSL